MRNTGFAVSLGINNDILHCAAKCDLNSDGVFVIRTDQAGNWSVDVAQRTPLCFLHNYLDRFMVAFKIPFHSLEHPGLCLDAVQPGGQLPKLLAQLISALDAAFLAQAVAVDGVGGCSDLILGSTQLLLAGFVILSRFLFSGSAGIQVGAQLLHPLFIFFQAGLQAPDICFSACQIGSQCAFFGTQLQELPGNTLSAGCHRSQFLLQLGKLPTLLSQCSLDLADSLLGLLQLGADTAAAVFLALQFLLNTGNIGVIVLDIALQDRDLSIQLLMGGIHHTDLDADIF